MKKVSRCTWTQEEDIIVNSYIPGTTSWRTLSLKLGKTRTDDAVRNRWNRLHPMQRASSKSNPSFKRTYWTPEEDTTLVAMVESIGKAWKEIAIIIQRKPGAVRNRYERIFFKTFQDAFFFQESVKA
jgi:hypothetical protein